MRRTQTWAILVDAYRDLNSRKMFWITMILSGVVVLLFAVVGTSGRSLAILWWKTPAMENVEQAQLLYKWIFSTFVVGFYLTWIAAILALISTAGLFPEFLTGGAIDLYLSKPIGRWRLFFTKYAAGLLFVTLQVTVFAAGSFVVLGLRGHTWEPSLFMAIPIVVVFFSYLYGICVLFGVMTRSTVAALLLTLLAWFFIFGLDYVDKQVSKYVEFLPMIQRQSVGRVQMLDREIAEKEKEQAGGAATTEAAATEPERAQSTVTVINGRRVEMIAPGETLENLRSEREIYARQAEGPAVPPALLTTQRVIVAIKTFVPKTRETTNLLDRYLMPDWELAKARGAEDKDEEQNPGMMMQMMDPTRGRSVWWVVGSSLVFELVCVGWAGWIFKRRDY